VSSTAHVPPFMFALMAILGFNEFIDLISNPLLLILVILIGVGCYVVHMLGLSAPAIKVVGQLFASSLGGLQKLMTDAMANKAQTQTPKKPHAD
jgi:hypothetical protein